MKIVLVGHVCIDKNSSENSSYTGGGSPLLYISRYLAKHFASDPELIAPYGRDFLPFAAGLQLLSPPQDGHTLVYKNITHNQHRTQQCEHIDTADPVPLTSDMKKCVAEADVICLAPLLPNYPLKYVRDLLATRKPGSVAILSPQGYLRTVDAEGNVSPRDFKEALDILPLFDVTIFSEDDQPDAIATARRWAQDLPVSQIIVTQASRGASLVTATGVTPVATDPVPEDQIVDSVGCGDTFSAAVMMSYAQERDIVTAIRAGNKAARAKLFAAGVN